MSKSYKAREVSLSNKFHMITEPIQVSQLDYLDDDETDHQWRAKSRRLQARRWHRIRNQLV